MPLRLRFARLRTRWAHRRTVIHLAWIVVALTVIGAQSVQPSVESEDALQTAVFVPVGHRVLSLPIDERVPPLNPGDMIDVYLVIDSFAGTDGSVDVLTDPGTVVSVSDSAFAVALVQDDIGRVANALREGGVLVVRR